MTKPGTKVDPMDSSLADCLRNLAREGMPLSVLKQLGKGAFLVTDGTMRYVLKLPVAPKTAVQRMACRVFRGNLKFKREADFYRNLGKGEAFRSLPLVRTDGTTFILIGYLEDARVLWEDLSFDSSGFLKAMIAFQTAQIPSGRSVLEERAVQFYFGVSVQILRFAFKCVKVAGVGSLLKVLSILLRDRLRQHPNGTPINLHNDILYNVLSDRSGNCYVIDFEEVTRESRWFLIDLIEPAFRSDFGLNWRLVQDGVDGLISTGVIDVHLDLRAQLRMALLFRLTHAIASRATPSRQIGRLVDFYKEVVLSEQGYQKWFVENASRITPLRPEPEVVVTVPDLRMPGGIAHYFSALKPHLSRRVRYITRGKRVTGGILFFRLLKDYSKFSREIRRPSCRVVHVNTSLGSSGVLRDAVFIHLAKMRRKRVVLFFRGWDQAYAKKVERRWLWLFRPAFFRSDCIMVLGSDFERTLHSWGRKGPVLRETTVVSESLTAGLTLEAVDQRARADDRPNARILFLGRLEEAKGVYVLLDAVKILRSRGLTCSVMFAGSGAEETHLKQQIAAEELSGISVPGQLIGAAKRQAFLEADLYVLPTRHGEGMPNSVLEAMAMGLPVVTTSVGGLKDFFEDQRMGLLVEEADPVPVAEKIERIWRDRGLRRRMSRRNFEYAREHFLAGKVSLRLERIWDSEIEAGSNPGESYHAETVPGSASRF